MFLCFGNRYQRFPDIQAIRGPENPSRWLLEAEATGLRNDWGWEGGLLFGPIPIENVFGNVDGGEAVMR